jgi:hypothetical protein
MINDTTNNKKTKITKYTTTEYNREKRLLSRLKSVYSSAKHFKPNQPKLIAEINAIHDSKDFKKSSLQAKAYFNGYYDCLHEQFQKENLIFAYEWKSVLYFPPISWDTMPEECRQAIMQNEGPECKTYYKGTKIVYFDSSMIITRKEKDITND